MYLLNKIKVIIINKKQFLFIKRGNTALVAAILGNATEISKLLIENNADVHISNKVIFFNC
jgi:hypothetical protein